MPSIHDQAALERHLRDLRINPQWLRPLRNAFYKRNEPADRALAVIPGEDRARLSIDFHCLELDGRHDSKIDYPALHHLLADSTP